jgi:hypothetical protein
MTNILCSYQGNLIFYLRLANMTRTGDSDNLALVFKILDGFSLIMPSHQSVIRGLGIFYEFFLVPLLFMCAFRRAPRELETLGSMEEFSIIHGLPSGQNKPARIFP